MKPIRTEPVHLVGSGPGDARLITVKGRELLERADIVIYDYLANPELLAHVPDGATMFYVGKKGYTRHVTQDEIDELLVTQALENPEACIVRLKGGDPFVFGRGGEEALALAAAGVDVEVVPGITAGVAAPAYAGIPVTHRGIACSVAFVTGRETPDKVGSDIDWDHLATGVDTICFYMGIRTLPTITSKLMGAGRAPETPVALVRWGSLPRQETLVSTLADVVADVERVGFEAPAIIVVGEVVSLREELAWFEKSPLFGKRIVVTRSRTQASALVERLSAEGADVLELPTIRIEPIADTSRITAAIDELPKTDWVVFTSANGVERFFDVLHDTGQDARAFASARVAAIGPSTARALSARGITADLVPSEYVAEGVVRALLDAGAAGSRVMIPRALVARDILPEALTEAGCTVDVVPVYETVVDGAEAAEGVLAALKDGTVDGITFTSSSTVKNFLTVMKKALEQDEETDIDVHDLLARVDIFSIGPITTDTLRSFDLEPTASADTFTIPGLVAAIHETYVDERGKETNR